MHKRYLNHKAVELSATRIAAIKWGIASAVSKSLASSSWSPGRTPPTGTSPAPSTAAPPDTTEIAAARTRPAALALRAY